MKIILIGFMGSGKTTIGKLLAEKLNLNFIEMDDVILKKSKRKNINEIFEKDGESKFRIIETEVAKELVNKEHAVISSGGGVITNKINIDYLKKEGVIVYLETSFESIKKRLENIDDRPLFKDKKSALNLYKKRLPIYTNFAQLVIATDKLNANQVADKIAKELNYGGK